MRDILKVFKPKQGSLLALGTGFVLGMTVIFLLESHLSLMMTSTARISSIPVLLGDGSANCTVNEVRTPAETHLHDQSSASDSTTTTTSTTTITTTTTTTTTRSSLPKDNFDDVYLMLRQVVEKQKAQILKLTKEKKNNRKKTVAGISHVEMKGNESVFFRFQMEISDQSLYEEDSEYIQQLLHEMATLPFKSLVQKEGGTQLKLIIDYPGGGQALYKPMRFPRTQETLPNHFYFSDYERHNAEVAAFHLDRLLGFRRAPPVTGRKVNLQTEVEKLAPGELLRTFFISPAGNVCFHGSCSYYCDTGHAICGNPQDSEASLAAFLPSKDYAKRSTWRSPWRRSYSKKKSAAWEKNNSYCESVKEEWPYDSGRRLLDMMDLSTFDFLTGNMDRHHYEMFDIFGEHSYFVHLDHGRAFGKPNHDEMSILAPVYQCCMFRSSTLQLLINYHRGPVSLGMKLKESLSKDPIDPVLVDSHYVAIDRRVEIILQTLRECLKKTPIEKVIYSHDDLYTNNNSMESSLKKSNASSFTESDSSTSSATFEDILKSGKFVKPEQ